MIYTVQCALNKLQMFFEELHRFFDRLQNVPATMINIVIDNIIEIKLKPSNSVH